MYKAGVSSGFMLLIFQTNLSEALEVLLFFNNCNYIYTSAYSVHSAYYQHKRGTAIY